MEIRDNYSIFNLFLDKKIKVFIDREFFYVHVPNIKDFYLNDKINGVFHIWTSSQEKIQKMSVIPCETSYDFLKIVLFNLGAYKEYSSIAEDFKKALDFFIPSIQIDYKNKELIVEDITITEQIWEYILYILRLSCGEKVEKPRTFTTEDERQFYLAQKKMDEKIKKIKAQKTGDSEALLKSFLTIQYKFNLSFDYLAEQTLAQIQWLQGYAAGAVSYEVNAQAFAAGNMKKGKKLDFFIK